MKIRKFEGKVDVEYFYITWTTIVRLKPMLVYYACEYNFFRLLACLTESLVFFVSSAYNQIKFSISLCTYEVTSMLEATNYPEFKSAQRLFFFQMEKFTLDKK